MDLPVNYNNISPYWRKKVREEYVKRQNGLCCHCKAPLTGKSIIKDKPINSALFPPNFFKFPVHLHHDHKTGLTIGAVHNRCNAILWQYHGE